MNALVRTELFYSKQKGYSKNICGSFFFTSGEIERLKYARFNQDSLRSDVFENLEDAVLADDAKVGKLGQRIICPKSITGRYQNCHSRLFSNGLKKFCYVYLSLINF